MATRYIYPDHMPKQPHLEGSCQRCGEPTLVKVIRGEPVSKYCSRKCSAQATAWKGNDAGYLALHERVYRARGKAKQHTCACGKRAHDWANLTGAYADISDYEAMCRKCHMRYDKERGIR